MKVLSSIFIIVLFVLSIPAQEKSVQKWTRIENENKKFAVSFPPDFIVNAEKDARGLRYRISGFVNGVLMRMNVSKDKAAKANLKNIRSFTGTDVTRVTKDDFLIVRVGSDASSKSYFQNIYVASDDYMYSLHIRDFGGSKGSEEIKRFLFSINLDGQQLFTQRKKRIWRKIKSSWKR